MIKVYQCVLIVFRQLSILVDDYFQDFNGWEVINSNIIDFFVDEELILYYIKEKL